MTGPRRQEYDQAGFELPDPTPVSVPLYPPQLSLDQRIAMFVRGEMSRRVAEEGHESYEEADDFDVDEEPDPLSAYELPEARPEWPGGVKDEDGDPPPDPSKKTQPEPATQAPGPSAEPTQPSKPA